MRLILILHRYLGVAVGLLMTVWCLSGFVMMYQGYPRLTAEERLTAQRPLDLTGELADISEQFPDFGELRGFRIEMMGGTPVLRLSPGSDGPAVTDLRTGEAIETLSAETVLAIARDYAVGHGIDGPPRIIAKIDKDQWTVQGASRRPPLYKIRFDGPAGQELYLNSRTGEAVQDTNRRERFLSWIGAVPHWLYPTALRQNGELWTAVVVWASIVGVFLTVTGVYVGVARFKRYRSGRWSPYRGWFYWHHIVGLGFGLLTLTWVTSGLFTMSPWGFLSSDIGFTERSALAGPLSGKDLKQFMAAAPNLAGPSIVRIESAPLSGKLFATTMDRNGFVARYRADGVAERLTAPELGAALGAVSSAPIAEFQLLSTEDDFYYGHHGEVKLPVYRAVMADAQRSTFYLDPDTGTLLRAHDPTTRASRWFRTGLHDLDFAWLRRRPLWDVVVLTLLAGVTAVCATGAWMSIARVRQDIWRIRQRLKRPQPD